MRLRPFVLSPVEPYCAMALRRRSGRTVDGVGCLHDQELIPANLGLEAGPGGPRSYLAEVPVVRFYPYLWRDCRCVDSDCLASGLVERSPLSFPLIFLGLGFLLGSKGLDQLDVGPHSPFLEVVATLTLALVLFLDAVKLQVTELGKRWLVPALILGPGTGLIIAIGALPFGLFLNFGWILAFIGGAVLASADPVVLREIVRDERIPRSVRQVLKI